MGAAFSNQFTADEVENLSSFSSDQVWNFDSDKWLSFMRFKLPLWEIGGTPLSAVLTSSSAIASAPPASTEAKKNDSTSSSSSTSKNNKNLTSLQAACAEYCDKLAKNDATTHNLATLAAVVVARLDKSWYFNGTDLEMTTTAVILLRVFTQYIVANKPVTSHLQDHLGLSPNFFTATSTAAITPAAAQLASSWTWASLLSACISFLSDASITPESYELHVHVLSLVLVLLSPQATGDKSMQSRGEEDFTSSSSSSSSSSLANNNNENGASSKLSTWLATRVGPNTASIKDPFLRAAMVLGHDTYTSPIRQTKSQQQQQQVSKSTSSSSGASSSSSSSSSAAAAAVEGNTGNSITRAQMLIRALLRNVSLDAPRTEDSALPSPGETSASGKTSLSILSARGEAARAYAKSGAADGLAPSSSKSSSTTNSSSSASSPSTSSTTTTTTTKSGSSSSSGPLKALDAIDRLASAASSVVTVPLSLVGAFFFDAVEPVGKPLAERSALVLLLLTHNHRAAETQAQWLPNPYRQALRILADTGAPTMTYAATPSALIRNNNNSSTAASQQSSSSSSSSSAAASVAIPVASLLPAVSIAAVSFKQLFAALVSLCETPLGTALLYTLLQASPAWSDQVLLRTDVDAVLLPLCQQLYYIPVLGADHRYLLLITILLFTQDAAFCETAHRRVKIPPTATTWFRERRLGEITLGSLLSLCLIRAVAATSGLATTGASDVYLHTNAFAALANMAPHVENVHPYTALKILTTLGGLHKKHSRLVQKIDGITKNFMAGSCSNSTNSSDSSATATASSSSSSQQQPPPPPLAVLAAQSEALTGLLIHYDSCIKVGAEALLAMCAPDTLPKNLDLLYAMLHERHVFDALANDPDFAPEVEPLLSLLAHFSSAVRSEEKVRTLAHAKSGSAGAAEAVRLTAEVAADVAAAAAAAAAATASSASSSSSDASSSSSTAISVAPAVVSGSPSSSSAATSTSTVSPLIDGGVVLWQATDVLRVLSDAVRSWKGDDRDKAAAVASDLATQRFTYTEAEEPDVFFVPYIWTLTYHYTKGDLEWDPASLKIFSVEGAVLYSTNGRAATSSSNSLMANNSSNSSNSNSSSSMNHHEGGGASSPLHAVHHSGGGHGFETPANTHPSHHQQ